MVIQISGVHANLLRQLLKRVVRTKEVQDDVRSRTLRQGDKTLLCRKKRVTVSVETMAQKT